MPLISTVQYRSHVGLMRYLTTKSLHFFSTHSTHTIPLTHKHRQPQPQHTYHNITLTPLHACSVVSNSLRHHGLYSPWNSPGQNTGVGGLSLLQGIFPTQESNPGLPHCRLILCQLSHKGIPRILEWVVYPFSSRSSWPRNPTSVFCTAGRFFPNWAIR